MRVTIEPAPHEIKLPNGQRVTPWVGRTFVRFSPDRKYWTTWQPLTLSTKPTLPKSAGVVFGGEVGVPRRSSVDYDKRLQAFMRMDVPWRSDEEALVKRIVASNKHYFRDHKPFVGYVQVLFEGSFYGGQRMRRVSVQTSYVVSGLHLAPKNKADYKGREGKWRFVHPDLR